MSYEDISHNLGYLEARVLAVPLVITIQIFEEH